MPHPQRGRATSEKYQPTDPSHVFQCSAPSGSSRSLRCSTALAGRPVAIKSGRRPLAAGRQMIEAATSGKEWSTLVVDSEKTKSDRPWPSRSRRTQGESAQLKAHHLLADAPVLERQPTAAVGRWIASSCYYKLALAAACAERGTRRCFRGFYYTPVRPDFKLGPLHKRGGTPKRGAS